MCGEKIPWVWTPPIHNPITHKNLSWTNKWTRPSEFCDSCIRRNEAIALGEKVKREALRVEAEKKALEYEITKTLGGERSSGWTFDRFISKTESQKRALGLAKSAASLRSSLYIWGKTTGTGKSHLAGSAYRLAMMEGVDSMFWKPGPLLRWLRVLDSAEQEERISSCVNSGVFVLDDFGVGNVTEFSLGAFYEIIDGRWMMQKNGLIITANLSLDDLAIKTGDDRLASRIAGICDVIEVVGDDMRLVKK